MHPYEEGYRQAIRDTIRHMEARIIETKVHADDWDSAGEYREFLRALDICKRYLEWILREEENNVQSM